MSFSPDSTIIWISTHQQKKKKYIKCTDIEAFIGKSDLELTLSNYKL